MPVKGQFTACVCVLLDRPAPIDAVAEALSPLPIARRVEAGDPWYFHGPTLIVPYRPEVNGFVSVDAVDQPWPDGMGDPQQEPMLFGAWSMGQFGPYAFPGGLARAAQQCWGWPEGRQAPQRHRAFVRLRASYAFGGGPEAPLFPEDYDPVAELRFLTDAAARLMRLPGVLCYFNPNGEVLSPADAVASALRFADAGSVPPLDLWSIVRLFNVDEGWMVMDTVGNSQFDHLGLPEPFPDVECCFLRERGDPNEVAPFLRNTTLYLLRQGLVFGDGDTIDGPGGRWRASKRRALLSPPRATLRFFPDGATPPTVLAAANPNPLA